MRVKCKQLFAPSSASLSTCWALVHDRSTLL